MPAVNSNSVDPDQMPPSAASDQGLHCLQMSHLWDAGTNGLPELFEPELSEPVHFQFKWCPVSFDYYNVLLKCLQLIQTV